MKHLKLAIVLLLGVFMAGVALKPVSAVGIHGQKKAAVMKVYACEKCEVASMKAGKCPMCGEKMMAMKANVAYSCADCHTTSNKAGKCPKCGKPMVKMAQVFACDMCHITATKAGKCPKCGMTMKEHDMKVSG